MATVNFSVPDEVKEAFNQTFSGMNKSAVIARLMLEAVEEERRRERRARAADALLELRRRAPPAGDAAIRRARVRGRP
jgi:hypothetical protein